MGDQVLPDDAIYLGVDGGGTKCNAVVMTADRQIIGSGVAGPANPFVCKDQAIESIQTSAKAAMSVAGFGEGDLSRVIAGVGLAGLNMPTACASMADWKPPFGHMFLTTDLEIACVGAHDGEDGAVIVVGTGSSAISMVNGSSRIIGAHGFKFGDTCSGAWIGFEAMRAILLAGDGIGQQTVLSESISDQALDDGECLVEKFANARPVDFARFAGLVFDAANAGDPVAAEIIQRGANYLNSVAGKLWETHPPAMSILGGLRQLIEPWLAEDVSSRLSQPRYPADIGAAIFAQRRYRDQLAAA